MAMILPLDVYTLTLCTIVVVFWTVVIFKAQAIARPWFPNLLVVPAFFLIVGLSLNRFHPPALGTYIVGAVHALLLVALMMKQMGRKN